MMDPNETPVLGCGFQPDNTHDEDPILESLQESALESRSNAPIEKRVYLLALACTGEFAQQYGGTMESVNSAFVTALNRFNQIYERDFAIKLMLIASNDLLIWLDPATDPYTNANNAQLLLQQNTNAITQGGGVPLGAFDMGHVFTMGCINGLAGIAAAGQVCKEGKASGVTCFYSTNINFIVKKKSWRTSWATSFQRSTVGPIARAQMTNSPPARPTNPARGPRLCLTPALVAWTRMCSSSPIAISTSARSKRLSNSAASTKAITALLLSQPATPSRSSRLITPIILIFPSARRLN
ncbi:MAG: hypothetical protein IPN33_13150 [Saprospiraceae bacterium]|nr:hypothetical protein [Saprospiraceae bacterium]